MDIVTAKVSVYSEMCTKLFTNNHSDCQHLKREIWIFLKTAWTFFSQHVFRYSAISINKFITCSRYCYPQSTYRVRYSGRYDRASDLPWCCFVNQTMIHSIQNTGWCRSQRAYYYKLYSSLTTCCLCRHISIEHYLGS